VNRWLLVRSDGRVLALPAGSVEELVEIASPLPAPGVLPAVRGVAPYRGRLVPLVHVMAAIGDVTPPPEVGTTAVAVLVDGRRMLLEVDEADAIVTAPETSLPPGWGGQWAVGAVRQPEGLVPVLNLEWLVDRLMRTAASRSV